MRFRSSLAQLLAIGQGGAIVEEGDGELILPNELNRVVTLGAPLDTLNAAIPSPVSQSALWGARSSVSGVQVAFLQDSPTLGSGIWRMHVGARFHFSGTTNAAAFSQLSFVDPDGIAVVFFSMSHMSGGQFTLAVDITIALARPGWLLRLERSATVAADQSYAGANAMLLKLT